MLLGPIDLQRRTVYLFFSQKMNGTYLYPKRLVLLLQFITPNLPCLHNISSFSDYTRLLVYVKSIYQ